MEDVNPMNQMEREKPSKGFALSNSAKDSNGSGEKKKIEGKRNKNREEEEKKKRRKARLLGQPRSASHRSFFFPYFNGEMLLLCVSPFLSPNAYSSLPLPSFF